MKKYLFFLIFSTLLFSCNNKIVFSDHVSEECQNYYHFINKTWIIDSDNIYHFKGYTDYWKEKQHDICIKEKCLIGLTKKEIINLFGTPSKELKEKGYHFFIYCMHPACNSEKMQWDTPSPAGLLFNFDAGRVEYIGISPLDINY